MKTLTLNEASEFLKSRNNLVILTHKRPDGDTTGCAGLLCRALRKLGKNAWILYNPDFTPKYYSYISGLTCWKLEKQHCLISVDVAAESMFPREIQGLEGRVELLLDHHGSNTGFAPQGIVRPEAAACAELILDLVEEMGLTLTKKMAECAYLGLSTDTGCFRFSNTTAATLRAAAKCLEAKADTYAINKIMFETISRPRLRLNAYMAEHMNFYADGKVALCKIPLEVERELGILADDMDDVANFARSVEGVQLAATLRTTRTGSTKLSLRAEPGYNASKICAHLGGGGHPGAAGAAVEGTQEEAERLLLEAMKAEGIQL